MKGGGCSGVGQGAASAFVVEDHVNFYWQMKYLSTSHYKC